MANVLAEREACTFGFVKWSTLPSSLIIFTSSIPWMLFTPSFFRQFYWEGTEHSTQLLKETPSLVLLPAVPEPSYHQWQSCELSSFSFLTCPFRRYGHSEASEVSLDLQAYLRRPLHWYEESQLHVKLRIYLSSFSWTERRPCAVWCRYITP